MRVLADVFTTLESAAQFERALDLLWSLVVVESHEAMEAAECVDWEEMRFLLDPGPGSTLLWAANALLERAALRTINALTSTQPSELTIESLRAQLLRDCKPELKQELQDEVALAWGDASFEEVRSKAIRHRNNLLAHLPASMVTKPDTWAKSQISLMEFKTLVDSAREMLEALSIHTGRGASLYRLSEDDHMSFIVSTVMRTSVVLNMPEQQPEFFPYHAKNFTDQQREMFMKWRKASGLPRVDLSPHSTA